MADDQQTPPDDAAPDELFTAAGRRPAPPPDSPYPDGPGGTGATGATDRTDGIDAADREMPTAPVRPARSRPPQPGSFGYHAPPPAAPDGTGGYRAGPYPAGPPATPAPQFGRRAPRQGPRPDADGYYPSDYYLGADWTRVVIGGLVTVVLGIAAVAAGLWLYEEFDPRDDGEEVITEVTPTPIELVPVFACAGDQTAVTEIPAPNALLVAGRTADSRWLAFRNPAAPPVQLWVEAERMPSFDPGTVGVVSCAASPQEFPTPRNVGAAPTPAGPTPTALPTP